MQRFLSAIWLVVLLVAAESACQKKPVVVPAPSPPASTPATGNSPTATPPRRAPRPVPATPAPPPSTPVAPRLGDMLTADQQRQYNADIDQSLARAQVNLGLVGKRRLTQDQQDRAAQVRTFIQQAQATRGSNLPGAKSLAERAEVLARDLAASLR